jgi:two-component system, LytTR family, response regulator
VNKIRAILVDDEESARDVLENLLLRFCPAIELVAKCSHLLQAVEVIKKERPQLVFLDIEMPRYSGFEIVRFFDQPDFNIIFVTAYDQYAIRAFDVAAIDYLLKPVDISRLKMAVQRVEKEESIRLQAQSLPVLRDVLQHQQIRNIVISDKGQQYVLPVESIIAIEAQESYCNLFTEGKKYVVSKNLKHFETVLESLPLFFRVHKSWIINRSFIGHYSRSELTIQLTNGLTTKLSKYKKAEFEQRLLQ